MQKLKKSIFKSKFNDNWFCHFTLNTNYFIPISPNWFEAHFGENQSFFASSPGLKNLSNSYVMKLTACYGYIQNLHPGNVRRRYSVGRTWNAIVQVQSGYRFSSQLRLWNFSPYSLLRMMLKGNRTTQQ